MTPQEEEYREIPLAGPEGYVAKVDLCEYERLAKSKWRPLRSKGKVYAVRHSPMVNGVVGPAVLMHREILGLEYGDPRQGDHALQDTLDNRRTVNGRENLRIATRLENTWNSLKKVYNTSGYKGVSEDKKASRAHPWRARITVNRKEILIGYFTTPELAHKAYEKAAIKHFGKFARSK